MIVLSQIILSDSISKDFAYIISNKDTQDEQIKTINLGHALKNPTPEPIENNTKINLFTKTYLSQLFTALEGQATVVDDKMLIFKNSSEIFLDDKRIALIPEYPKQNLKDTINSLFQWWLLVEKFDVQVKNLSLVNAARPAAAARN